MSNVSRRAFLRSTGAAAGALSLAQVALAQTAPAQTQAPQAPEDPTKVQGQNPSALGERSPFEHPERLVPGTTSSRTPLDALNGMITPSDLHYERHHAGVPTI